MYSLSHSAFGGTDFTGAHIPGCPGAQTGRMEVPLRSGLFKISRGLGRAGSHATPLSESPPPCCRLPTRREPGSPSEPIRRGLRRALPFSEPIGGQPERGLPGLVGAAGCRLPGSHVRTAAYAPRLQVIAGTLVGTAGVERGPARACVSPARGGRRRDPANRSSESARAQAAPGRRLCQVPALLGRPGPGLAATSGPATATE